MSIQKLDDIIENLEEKKELSEDKNSWINEKILELEANIIKNGEKLDQNPIKTLENSSCGKNKAKAHWWDDKNRQSKNKRNYQYSDNVFVKFDEKDEARQFLENTPQQHFLRKRNTENFGAVEFHSPSPYSTFPNRQLPSSVNIPNILQRRKEGSPKTTKLNEISQNLHEEEKNRALSPNISQRNSNGCFQKEKISPKMNNQIGKIDTLINNSNKNRGEAEKLKILKEILTDFINSEQSQKNKLMKMIDNLIINKEIDTSSKIVSTNIL